MAPPDLLSLHTHARCKDRKGPFSTFFFHGASMNLTPCTNPHLTPFHARPLLRHWNSVRLTVLTATDSFVAICPSAGHLHPLLEHCTVHVPYHHRHPPHHHHHPDLVPFLIIPTHGTLIHCSCIPPIIPSVLRIAPHDRSPMISSSMWSSNCISIASPDPLPAAFFCCRLRCSMYSLLSPRR